MLSCVFIVVNSCILKEFKYDEITLEDDWGMQIVSPLFYGDLEFKDLVHDWKSLIVNPAETVIQLKFSGDSVINFPERLIFEPAAVIDSFNFLIDGDDYISDAAFKYKVTNGSPFPLNLQIRFFDKYFPGSKGPAILPPAFPAANLENGNLAPVTTEYTLPLTSEQLDSFKKGNRVEFVTWFDPANSSFSADTLSAHYPISLSIILTGIVHGYYQ